MNKNDFEYKAVERKDLDATIKQGWELAYPDYAHYGPLVIVKRLKRAESNA